MKLSDVIRSRKYVFDGGKLSMNNCSITLIDSLPESITKSISIVFISNNYLEKLTGIHQFVNIRVLNLSNNLLLHYEDILPLRKLKFLEKLMLQNNPVTFIPFYREIVIEVCDQLSVLDEIKVSKEEKLDSQIYSIKLKTLLVQMNLNELHFDALNHFRQLRLCHISFANEVFPRFRHLRAKHIGDGFYKESMTTNQGLLNTPPLSKILNADLELTESFSLSDSVSSKSICKSAFKILLNGGVFRKLQLLSIDVYDKLSQDTLRKYHVRCLRAMTSFEKNQFMTSRESRQCYWDDLISECLKNQSLHILGIIEALNSIHVRHEDCLIQHSYNLLELQELTFIDNKIDQSIDSTVRCICGACRYCSSFPFRNFDGAKFAQGTALKENSENGALQNDISRKSYSNVNTPAIQIASPNLQELNILSSLTVNLPPQQCEPKLNLVELAVPVELELTEKSGITDTLNVLSSLLSKRLGITKLLTDIRDVWDIRSLANIVDVNRRKANILSDIPSLDAKCLQTIQDIKVTVNKAIDFVSICTRNIFLLEEENLYVSEVAMTLSGLLVTMVDTSYNSFNPFVETISLGAKIYDSTRSQLVEDQSYLKQLQERHDSFKSNLDAELNSSESVHMTLIGCYENLSNIEKSVKEAQSAALQLEIELRINAKIKTWIKHYERSKMIDDFIKKRQFNQLSMSLKLLYRHKYFRTMLKVRKKRCFMRRWIYVFQKQKRDLTNDFTTPSACNFDSNIYKFSKNNGFILSSLKRCLQTLQSRIRVISTSNSHVQSVVMRRKYCYFRSWFEFVVKHDRHQKQQLSKIMHFFLEFSLRKMKRRINEIAYCYSSAVEAMGFRLSNIQRKSILKWYKHTTLLISSRQCAVRVKSKLDQKLIQKFFNRFFNIHCIYQLGIKKVKLRQCFRTLKYLKWRSKVSLIMIAKSNDFYMQHLLQSYFRIFRLCCSNAATRKQQLFTAFESNSKRVFRLFNQLCLSKVSSSKAMSHYLKRLRTEALIRLKIKINNCSVHHNFQSFRNDACLNSESYNFVKRCSPMFHRWKRLLYNRNAYRNLTVRFLQRNSLFKLQFAFRHLLRNAKNKISVSEEMDSNFDINSLLSRVHDLEECINSKKSVIKLLQDSVAHKIHNISTMDKDNLSLNAFLDDINISTKLLEKSKSDLTDEYQSTTQISQLIIQLSNQQQCNLSVNTYDINTESCVAGVEIISEITLSLQYQYQQYKELLCHLDVAHSRLQCEVENQFATHLSMSETKISYSTNKIALLAEKVSGCLTSTVGNVGNFNCKFFDKESNSEVIGLSSEKVACWYDTFSDLEVLKLNESYFQNIYRRIIREAECMETSILNLETRKQLLLNNLREVTSELKAIMHYNSASGQFLSNSFSNLDMYSAKILKMISPVQDTDFVFSNVLNVEMKAVNDIYRNGIILTDTSNYPSLIENPVSSGESLSVNASADLTTNDNDYCESHRLSSSIRARLASI